MFAPHARMRAAVVALAGPDPLLADRLCRAAREMGLDPGKLAVSSAGMPPGSIAPGGVPPSGILPPAEGLSPETAASPPRKKRPASRTWAMLMARIYETLPLSCPRCQAAMKIIAFITRPDTIARILEHLGEPVRPPPVSPARASPQFDAQGELAFA